MLRYGRCGCYASRSRQLRVADAWLFCGCPPSTDDRCQGSSWTATLHHATLFSLLAPLDTPACLADAAANPTAPDPFPAATPIHSHTHARTHTRISASISQALLDQTAVILATNGSHANAPRRIHSGNLKYQSLGCVCVCVLGKGNVYCWAENKSF